MGSKPEDYFKLPPAATPSGRYHLAEDGLRIFEPKPHPTGSLRLTVLRIEPEYAKLAPVVLAALNAVAACEDPVDVYIDRGLRRIFGSEDGESYLPSQGRDEPGGRGRR